MRPVHAPKTASTPANTTEMGVSLTVIVSPSWMRYGGLSTASIVSAYDARNCSSVALAKYVGVQPSARTFAIHCAERVNWSNRFVSQMRALNGTFDDITKPYRRTASQTRATKNEIGCGVGRAAGALHVPDTCRVESALAAAD